MHTTLKSRFPVRKLDLTNVDVFRQRTLSAPRHRSNRLAECGASGTSRDRVRRTGRDADLHLHVEMVRRGPDEGAVERDRVMRIAHDRNGDKADLATLPLDGSKSIQPAPGR